MDHNPAWRRGGPHESNYIASCRCGWKLNIAASTPDLAIAEVLQHRSHPVTTVTLTVDVKVIDSPLYALALRRAVIERSGMDDFGPMPLGDLVALAMRYRVDLIEVARSIGAPWIELDGPRYEAADQPQGAAR